MELLTEIARILKPSGRLILKEPTGETIDIRIAYSTRCTWGRIEGLNWD